MSMHLNQIAALVAQAGLCDSIKCCDQISSDGSDRILYRVKFNVEPGCLVVFPSPTMAQGMAEARSCALICDHLSKHHIASPKFIGFDEASGAVILEDLGNILLYDIVQSGKHAGSEILSLYRKAVEELAKFQVVGKEGFLADFCWDTSHYDKQLMLNRESEYFYRELCERWLGLGKIWNVLQHEFVQLAERVAQEPAHFLMHRDFQSRNLMVQGNHIRIIDFQGARFGPLGYDLCSLINDPYVSLNDECKDELARHYVATVANYISLDLATFFRGYYHIALQRNLQVLGAYAFLSQVKRKCFFRQFIDPALCTLQALLKGHLCGKYPELEATVELIISKIAVFKPQATSSVNII